MNNQEDPKKINELGSRHLLSYCSARAILVVFLWLVQVLAAVAQIIPRDGETIQVGTFISVPCSCEGNACSLWPLPDSFPKGFQLAKKQITSIIEKGTMFEGQWIEERYTVGSAVTEPWKGGKCIIVDKGGFSSDKPAPAIFSFTEPGTYRFRITRFELASVFDCRSSQCVTPSEVKAETTDEDRYFHVVEPAKRCDPVVPCPEGSFCKGDFSESPFTYFFCCPKGSIPCNRIYIPDTPKNQRECRECGNPCSGATTCCSGKCVDLSSDNANCGRCGNACGGWGTLESGDVGTDVPTVGEVFLNFCAEGKCIDEVKAKCSSEAPYPCGPSCRDGGSCCTTKSECLDYIETQELKRIK